MACGAEPGNGMGVDVKVMSDPKVFFTPRELQTQKYAIGDTVKQTDLD